MRHRRTFLIATALFILALLPRALSGPFVTIDEAYHWFARVDLFIRALRAGNYAATNLIGHPGVTTLWLGSFGDTLFHWAAELGLVAQNDGAASRALTRLPLAIVAALCVALAYPLLRRLLGDRMALLATLFWATEPFLVAHAQLLHLDSLLSSFMTLSVLALLAGIRDQGAGIRGSRHKETGKHGDKETTRQGVGSEEWGVRSEEDSTFNIQHSTLTGGHSAFNIQHSTFMVVSAFFAGLALLTKSPALFLLPFIALLLMAHAWYTYGHSGLPTAALRFGLWCVIAALVWVALWPAAWVDLLGAVRRVLFQAQADGGSPHGWGNFFMGKAIADPGPLFYLVAVPLRLAPWTFIGLLALVGLGLRRGLLAWRSGGLQRFLMGNSTVLALLLFVLLFIVMMSIPPKKFDRYVLPIFPALDILAAIGLLALVESLFRHKDSKTRSFFEPRRHEGTRPLFLNHEDAKTRRREETKLQHSHRIPPLLPFKVQTLFHFSVFSFLRFCAFALLLLNLAWYHPYELAYYNPLLGGAATALRTIPVGWGEGYELAGAFVAAQPNGADWPVAALYGPALDPFVPAKAAPMDWALEPGKVDYAVVYIDQIQRRYKPELFESLRASQKPIYTAIVHGIPYAEVYAIAPAVDVPLSADFGSAIHLRGFTLDSSALESSGILTVTLSWEARAIPERDYSLFVHVFDSVSTKIAQVDVPLGDARWPSSRWTAGHFITQVQQVPLPAATASGSYRVVIGVYDPVTFQRLPLVSEGQHDAADGEGSLILK